MSGTEDHLRAIRRGIAHAQSRLLSKQELLELLRANLQAVRDTLPRGSAVEVAERALMEATEVLLKAESPVADEMRDQGAEDGAFGDVLAAFAAFEQAAAGPGATPSR